MKNRPFGAAWNLLTNGVPRTRKSALPGSYSVRSGRNPELKANGFNGRPCRVGWKRYANLTVSQSRPPDQRPFESILPIDSGPLLFELRNRNVDNSNQHTWIYYCGQFVVNHNALLNEFHFFFKIQWLFWPFSFHFLNAVESNKWIFVTKCCAFISKVSGPEVVFILKIQMQI